MHPKALSAFYQLKRCASGQRTITYGELGQLIGMHHRQVKTPLHNIQDACTELGTPPITGLVVLKATGLPSSGFRGNRGRAEYQAVLRQICAFDWTAITHQMISDAWGRSRR